MIRYHVACLAPRTLHKASTWPAKARVDPYSIFTEHTEHLSPRDRGDKRLRSDPKRPLTQLFHAPDPTQPHAQGARGRHHRRPFKATHAPWPLLELAQAPKRAPTSLEPLQAALRPCRPMHSPQPAAERDTSKQSNVRGSGDRVLRSPTAAHTPSTASPTATS